MSYMGRKGAGKLIAGDEPFGALQRSQGSKATTGVRPSSRPAAQQRLALQRI
jgi:hypothetical protein